MNIKTVLNAKLLELKRRLVRDSNEIKYEIEMLEFRQEQVNKNINLAKITITEYQFLKKQIDEL